MPNLRKVLLFLVYMQGDCQRTQSWDPATGTSQGKSVAKEDRQPHVLRH